MNFRHIGTFALAALGGLSVAGCTTGAAGPVEVTRFHQPETLARLGNSTIFIDSAPGLEMSSLELSPYKAAVAKELVRLGYREVPRAEAAQIAQVDLERFTRDAGPQRSPVSVGVGGSTGGYRSGVGLGIGINLGGNKSREETGTALAVSIRDSATGDALWEGRANFSVSAASPLAATAANASIIADALFREFPGNNGETIEITPKK